MSRNHIAAVHWADLHRASERTAAFSGQLNNSQTLRAGWWLSACVLPLLSLLLAGLFQQGMRHVQILQELQASHPPQPDRRARTTAWPYRNRPVGELIVYDRNPRKHPERQIVSLAASITDFGFTMPVLVDEAGTIIAGEARVAAARRITDLADLQGPVREEGGMPLSYATPTNIVFG